MQTWCKGLGVILGIVVLAGCGSLDTRKTVEQLTNARVAVEAAEKSGAQTHAPNELRFAQDSLAIASDSYAGEDFERAFAFSKKATIYALVAKARSQQKTSEKQLTDEKAKLEKLRVETQSLVQSNPSEIQGASPAASAAGNTTPAEGGVKP